MSSGSPRGSDGGRYSQIVIPAKAGIQWMGVSFDFPPHDVYEEEAHLLTVVGVGPDEPGEFGVADDPLSPIVRGLTDVVVDEVARILESVDGEQSCCGEPVTGRDTADESVHHVDEDSGDVDTVVGFF